MALFGKKTCAVCGKKITAMGSLSIGDGAICMDCKNACSKQLRGLRRMKTEDVRAHLRYREENARRLRAYHPDIIIGKNGPMLAANSHEKTFCFALSDTVFNEQADLFDYDQVTGVEIDEISHEQMPETRCFAVLIDAPETKMDRIRIPETGSTAQRFAAMWDFFQAILHRPYEKFENFEN